MGIIFCIVLLTVGLGFEDLTYGLCMIISEHVSLRNNYGAASAKRYLSERGGEILNSAAIVPLAFVVLPYRLVQNDSSHNIAQYLDTPSSLQ